MASTLSLIERFPNNIFLISLKIFLTKNELSLQYFGTLRCRIFPNLQPSIAHPDSVAPEQKFVEELSVLSENDFAGTLEMNSIVIDSMVK